MGLGKLYDEDFGATLQTVKGFAWNFPVGGFEGMLGSVVPFHEFLAKSWAASCLSESLCESACDSFCQFSEVEGPRESVRLGLQKEESVHMG